MKTLILSLTAMMLAIGLGVTYEITQVQVLAPVVEKRANCLADFDKSVTRSYGGDITQPSDLPDADKQIARLKACENPSPSTSNSD